MGVSPIPIPDGVNPAKASTAGREVSPTRAVDPTARMDDDSYNARQETAERGLEEDEEKDEPAAEEEENVVMPSELIKKVDFFA